MQEKEEMFRGDSGFIEERFHNPVGDEVTYCRRCKSHVTADKVHNCMGSHLKPTPSLADWEELKGSKLQVVNEEDVVDIKISNETIGKFGKRLDEEELSEPYTDIELMHVLDQCVTEFLESNAEGKKLAQGAIDWLSRKYGRMSL